MTSRIYEIYAGFTPTAQPAPTAIYQRQGGARFVACEAHSKGAARVDAAAQNAGACFDCEMDEMNARR